MIDGIRVKDQALRRFVKSLDAKTATALAIAHDQQVVGFMVKNEKRLPKMTYNGKSGYKRNWGHFWRSMNENEPWRWRTRYADQPDKYSGIKYNKPFNDVAGRKSSEQMSKRFHTNKRNLEVVTRNDASYSGYNLGTKRDQSRRQRQIGHIGMEEAAQRTEKERDRLTLQVLHNKAKKAGGT